MACGGSEQLHPASKQCHQHEIQVTQQFSKDSMIFWVKRPLRNKWLGLFGTLTYYSSALPPPVWLFPLAPGRRAVPPAPHPAAVPPHPPPPTPSGPVTCVCPVTLLNACASGQLHAAHSQAAHSPHVLLSWKLALQLLRHQTTFNETLSISSALKPFSITVPLGLVPGASLLSPEALWTVSTVPPLITTSRLVTPKPGSPPWTLLCSRASPQACRHRHSTTLQKPKVYHDVPLTKNGTHIHTRHFSLTRECHVWCCSVFLPLHSINEKTLTILPI